MKLNYPMIGVFLVVIGLSVKLNAASGASTPLSGFQETPSILSDGRGSFMWRLNNAGTSISYTLSFAGLSSDAAAAHIHFAQRGVSGGVMAFLCGGTGNKPACPVKGGKVTGTLSAEDIMALPSQGITQGNFTAFLAALSSGNTYVNVHSMMHPGGEIRGQISERDQSDPGTFSA